MGLNPIKLGFQAVPWIVSGYAVMEGYAIFTNTPPILPDFGLNAAIKGLIDPLTSWINAVLHPPTTGGATCGGKTCPTGQHLNTATCLCLSDTGCGAKTCPLAQHLDTNCICVTDQVCNGKVCIPGQHLDPACNCVPNTVNPPGGTLQNGYQSAMRFIVPTQGLRWPISSINVIVNTNESSLAADVSAVTLITDSQPVPMSRSTGGVWTLTVPLSTGNHTMKAVSTYKNGWTTATPTVTFTIL